MREILFRGKEVYFDKKWVDGYIAKGDRGEMWIVYGDVTSDHDGMTPVVAETVGQYTGLKDKNGVKIFEGDIVQNDEFTGEVYWSERGMWDCQSYILGGYNEKSEVIGNIHDNPELSEVAK